jgi:hypothetical protein
MHASIAFAESSGERVPEFVHHELRADLLHHGVVSIVQFRQMFTEFLLSNQPSALATDILGLLVVAKRHEPRMPQVPVLCPFHELELTDQNRLDPATVPHLFRS